VLGQLARRVGRAGGHVLRPKPSPTAQCKLTHSVCNPAVAQISCERYGCWRSRRVIVVLMARLALSVSRRGARLPRQLAARGASSPRWRTRSCSRLSSHRIMYVYVSACTMRFGHAVNTLALIRTLRSTVVVGHISTRASTAGRRHGQGDDPLLLTRGRRGVPLPHVVLARRRTYRGRRGGGVAVSARLGAAFGRAGGAGGGAASQSTRLHAEGQLAATQRVTRWLEAPPMLRRSWSRSRSQEASAPRLLEHSAVCVATLLAALQTSSARPPPTPRARWVNPSSAQLG